MALYESSLSPLFQRFFQPVIEAYPHSSKPYDCQELTDLDFIEMGIKRCVSASVTGRDFLQHHGDNGRKEVSVDLHFKALQSERRLANLGSIFCLLAESQEDCRALFHLPREIKHEADAVRAPSL